MSNEIEIMIGFNWLPFYGNQRKYGFHTSQLKVLLAMEFHIFAPIGKM